MAAMNYLQDLAGFIKIKTRVTREQFVRITLADGADHVDPDLAIREKGLVHFVGIKAGHRSAVESQAARGHHEIGGLQRAVTECGIVDGFIITDIPGARIGVREQLGQFFLEFHVHADNGDDRGRAAFLDITLTDALDQAIPGFATTYKVYSGRAAICTGRSHFHQLIDLLQLFVADLGVLPAVMTAGGIK